MLIIILGYIVFFVCLFFCEEQLYLSSRVKMKTWERRTFRIDRASVCACAYDARYVRADLHVKKAVHVRVN